MVISLAAHAKALRGRVASGDRRAPAAGGPNPVRARAHGEVNSGPALHVFSRGGHVGHIRATPSKGAERCWMSVMVALVG